MWQQFCVICLLHRAEWIKSIDGAVAIKKELRSISFKFVQIGHRLIPS